MLRHVLRGLCLILCLLLAEPVLAVQPTAVVLPALGPLPAVASQVSAFDCAEVTEIPRRECEALVALYHATDGPNWYDNTGWLQTLLPCSWKRVTCMAGHVSQLGLANNRLNGLLPSELGGLSELQSLGLSLNSLSGPIPLELSLLTALQGLALSSNRLSGPLLPEIGNLIALQYLDLSNNQLSGPIPAEIGKLIHLQLLELQHNQLNGAIPSEIGNLVALEYLDLSNNQLSGPIPPELGNLTNIRARWTSAHTFGVLRPPPIGGYLYLYGNRLSGPVPVELSKLSEAAGVGLGCNQLSGPLPPEVARVLNVIFEGNVDYNLLTIDPALSPARYWYKTQTVPPTDLQAVANAATVTLTWTPIPYTAHGGFYEVSYATAPDGPYIVHGWTADKTASSYTITGLRLDVTYYFRVRTFTAAHPSYWCNQQSALVSDYSAVVSTGGGTSTPSATPTKTNTPAATPTATPTATSTPTVTTTATPAPMRRWLPLVWR